MKRYRFAMGLGIAFAAIYDLVIETLMLFEQGAYDGFDAEFDDGSEEE